MGSSSPAPENPFQAAGLRAGLPLTLEVTVGDAVSTHVTLVEEIGQELLAVLRPMTRLKTQALPTGALVHAVYIYEGKSWRFVTDVAASDAHAEIDYLGLPVVIEATERRGAFRLATILEPIELFRLAVDEEDSVDLTHASTIVDIGEGGICLSSRARLREGERLGIRFVLPGIGEVSTRVLTRSVRDPVAGFRNFHVHCAFISPGVRVRNDIARFVMARQLELSRRGNL